MGEARKKQNPEPAQKKEKICSRVKNTMSQDTAGKMGDKKDEGRRREGWSDSFAGSGIRSLDESAGKEDRKEDGGNQPDNLLLENEEAEEDRRGE